MSKTRHHHFSFFKTYTKFIRFRKRTLEKTYREISVYKTNIYKDKLKFLYFKPAIFYMHTLFGKKHTHSISIYNFYVRIAVAYCIYVRFQFIRQYLALNFVHLWALLIKILKIEKLTASTHHHHLRSLISTLRNHKRCHDIGWALNQYMGIQNSNKCKTIKNGDNFHLKAFFIRRVFRFLYHPFVTIYDFFVGSRRRPNLTIYSLIPLELFKIRWKLNQTYRKHFEFRYKKNYCLVFLHKKIRSSSSGWVAESLADLEAMWCAESMAESTWAWLRLTCHLSAESEK